MHENTHDESQLYNLTLDVNNLKQQVQTSLTHKSIHETRSLMYRQRFDEGVLCMTHRFFHISRKGFRDSGLCGSNVFLEQWRWCKKLLQSNCISVSSIHILVSDSESCVVECKGGFEGRLTLEAIKTLFPHILQDAELLCKVVNCRLVCPRMAFLYFDASSCLVWYYGYAGLFAGLRCTLTSSPSDVITLMANARVSSEGSLIPDPDVGRVGVLDD